MCHLIAAEAEVDLGSRAPCHGLVEPKSKAFSRKKGLGSTLEDVSVKLANQYYTQFGT